ncbi:MAG: MATE family efflux transporter [Acidobacteria bacterium]|nr:MATE family efflux transporter [Acidobacteriota bacterium]
MSVESKPTPVAVTPVAPALIEPSCEIAPEVLSPTAPKHRRKLDRSIVEGPISAAVWKIAWPTVLQNAIGGLQGIIDHAMVGHYVGFTGNAAIGVSWQIFLVVIVFISSLFTGMGVLVARFAGANDHDKVNTTVYQAFLTAFALSVLILAPVGYFTAPWLLDMINATPEVRAEALPFLRTMFLFSIGMLMFFMLSGALRAAGDARTGLYLGVAMTVLNITLNVVLITGAGPIPAFGTQGAAMGTVIASATVSSVALWLILEGKLVVHFPRSMSWKPDWAIIRQLFKFGLPTGIQGVAMNVAGVLLLRFIGSLEHSAEAQAAYTVGYAELFSLITWTSVGLMGAAAAVAGQNLGAGHPERSQQAVYLAARVGVGVAGVIGALFLLIPEQLLAIFGLTDPNVVRLGKELLRFLSVSGLFITVALTYTGGLQGTGDTRSPLFITLISQVLLPLGICFTVQQFWTLHSTTVWTAILVGHFTRCVLTVARFQQGHWRRIVVDAR